MTHDSVATAENSRATTRNSVATAYDSRPTTPESHPPTRDLPETSADLREIPANSVETIHDPVASTSRFPSMQTTEVAAHVTSTDGSAGIVMIEAP
jgi:hypothetical protein